MPAMPMADNRAPIVVRNQGYKERDQYHHGDGATSVGHVARNCRRREHKDDGQTDKQNIEGDSFGVFWRSAPSTSLIMRSRKVEPSSLSDLMGGTITICVRIAELIRA